jgi:hypothetical protein
MYSEGHLSYFKPLYLEHSSYHQLSVLPCSFIDRLKNMRFWGGSNCTVYGYDDVTELYFFGDKMVLNGLGSVACSVNEESRHHW